MNQNQNPNGFYDPQTGAFVPIAPQKKKKKVWPWIVAAVVVLGVIGAAANKSEPSSDTGKPAKAADSAQGPEDAGHATGISAVPAPAEPGEEATAEPEPDLSAVPTEYTLSAGYYTAGTDIPAGRFNLTAVSGTGNVSSSTNQFTEGGFSAIMGISDLEMYSETYNGAKLPEGAYIHVSGNLVLKMEYIRVDSAFTGRTADESAAITLTPGQYVVGEDFPSGTYTLVADSGTGSVSSSEIFNGGINETVGISDLDMYIPRYENIAMKDGWDLKVSGLTIRLIPMQ